MPKEPKATPPPFAARTEGLEPFLAMEVMERAFALERDGVEVDHLEIGEPDFPPPRQAVEACERALCEGQTHYSDSRGLVELREAIARDAADRFAASVDPGSILVTSGTSPAMLLVCSLLLDPGDEVIIPTPHYPCYPNFVRYCGGVPVLVETSPQDAWAIDVDAVRARMTGRTRAIMISAPANPTGAIQSRETVDALAALGVPLLSDEIYDGLVYDGAQIASAHNVDGDAFVLDGFSKRYAMTGFRLGWVVAPEWAKRRLQIMQQNLFISASRFVQHAGIAALEHGADDVARMREEYGTRRDRLAAGLEALGFELYGRPKGAFYLFAGAQRFGADSLALANTLLERAHVGVCPGVDFGQAGEGMLRFCYAVSEASIDRALERLEAVLPELEVRNSA
ncbi:MAG: pyridoxal phosphate-dependent aminotransferase [Myxococcota bacterium]|jgi:aspartate/methionine/tyrosine aminotransferase|nr:pyridoxal phosphate-dependent aminotransferase [Myxococcota bacterium]